MAEFDAEEAITNPVSDKNRRRSLNHSPTTGLPHQHLNHWLHCGPFKGLHGYGSLLLRNDRSQRFIPTLPTLPTLHYTLL